MPLPLQNDAAMTERIRDVLDADITKLVLSLLIILSVIPQLEPYALVFFGIFFVEIMLRIAVLRQRLRERSLDRVEIVVLSLDVIAMLSFLPLDGLFSARYLRLVRLSRLVLLFGYWQQIVREIWIIVARRERKYQLLFVASAVLLLAFCSAILLQHVEGFAVDLNEDGMLSLQERTDPDFWMLVWWSFRQIQDPGNLLRDPTHSLAFAMSVLLTLSGVFIMAFLIGIGTTVVEELVQVSRQRRLGIRGHSLIANIAPQSRVLVEELVTYYKKSLRAPRLVTLGAAPHRYAFLYADHLRRVRYRSGSPNIAHDLTKVDTDRARRVILLGQNDQAESDAEVISQILAVHEVNAQCPIFAELMCPENVPAALAAATTTVPILSRRFLALLSSRIIASPGLQPLYDELLSTRGHEIYTCVYGAGVMRGIECPPASAFAPFSDLLRYALTRHGVTLLGYLRRTEPNGTLLPVINPAAGNSPTEPKNDPTLVGFFGIADNFEQMRQCTLDLPNATRELSPQPSRRESEQKLSIPTCTIDNTETKPRRILVCGFHDGLVDLCEHLALLCETVDMHLLVPSKAHAESLLHTLTSGNCRCRISKNRPDAFVRFTRHDDTCCDYVICTDETTSSDQNDNSTSPPAASTRRLPRTGRLCVNACDWSKEHEMVDPACTGAPLNTFDTIVYTYATCETDPDAKTALALLKLLRIAAETPAAVHPELRIVCVVSDSNKADLLERRFATPTAQRASTPAVTVVSVDYMRNAFVAQAVFVPGIWDIYEELIGHSGHLIQRLRVPDGVNTAAIGYEQILLGLYKQHNCIPIAVEITEENATRLLVSPKPGVQLPRSSDVQLRYIYAIGEK